MKLKYNKLYKNTYNQFCLRTCPTKECFPSFFDFPFELHFKKRQRHKAIAAKNIKHLCLTFAVFSTRHLPAKKKRKKKPKSELLAN